MRHEHAPTQTVPGEVQLAIEVLRQAAHDTQALQAATRLDALRFWGDADAVSFWADVVATDPVALTQAVLARRREA